MINHLIILSDAWSMGTRIALHYAYEGLGEGLTFNEDYTRIQNCFEKGKIPIGFHTCQSMSYSRESIVEKDRYFDDVTVIDSVEEFIKIVKMDEILSSIVIGRYILNLTLCDETNLNILLYLSHAEYLFRNEDPLFVNRIRVEDGIPVTGSVSERIRDNRLKMDGNGILYTKVIETATKARIIFSYDGVYKAGYAKEIVKKSATSPRTNLWN